MSYFRIKTIFQDSNGIQAFAVFGGVVKDMAKAVKRAQALSLQRGLAEVVDGHNNVVAAFRAGQEVGSLL